MPDSLLEKQNIISKGLGNIAAAHTSGYVEARNRIEIATCHMSSEEKRRFLIKERQKKRKNRVSNLKKRVELDKKIKTVESLRDICDDLINWLETEPSIESSVKNSYYDVIDAMGGGRFFVLFDDVSALRPWPKKEAFLNSTVFSVTSSYSNIFTDTDVEEGDFRLPYDSCVFQFCLGGKTVLVFAQQGDPITISCIIQSQEKWFVPTVEYSFYGNKWVAAEKDKALDGFMGFMGREIRAVSILLDASAIEASVVRAGSKLNKARIRRNKQPVNDYHVIDLRNRKKYISESAGTHKSPRLHFRRGHWRHFDGWKTWVRWCVVGSPENGTIISDYMA